MYAQKCLKTNTERKRYSGVSSYFQIQLTYFSRQTYLNDRGTKHISFDQQMR
jgi:hypothetical protein